MSEGFEIGHKVLIWIAFLNSNKVSHKRSQLSFVVLTALCKNAFVVSGGCTECIKTLYKEPSPCTHSSSIIHLGYYQYYVNSHLCAEQNT